MFLLGKVGWSAAEENKNLQLGQQSNKIKLKALFAVVDDPPCCRSKWVSFVYNREQMAVKASQGQKGLISYYGNRYTREVMSTIST